MLKLSDWVTGTKYYIDITMAQYKSMKNEYNINKGDFPEDTIGKTFAISESDLEILKKAIALGYAANETGTRNESQEIR